MVLGIFFLQSSTMLLHCCCCNCNYIVFAFIRWHKRLASIQYTFFSLRLFRSRYAQIAPCNRIYSHTSSYSSFIAKCDRFNQMKCVELRCRCLKSNRKRKFVKKVVPINNFIFRNAIYNNIICKLVHLD